MSEAPSMGHGGLPEAVDLLIVDTMIVTMNAQRHIITDAAIAVRADLIVAVGKSVDLREKFTAKETVDGRRFVITPGLVNTHVHVTGEPLTRGLVPDDCSWAENVFEWLVPVHAAYTEADERLACQLAALEMLRSGTTCFLEAGTINFLDAVADGLNEAGIRGRIGQWAADFDPQTGTFPGTDAAIAVLENEMQRYPAESGARIAAWPILIGHWTCSAPLWQAAKRIADTHSVGVAAHMSPVAADPVWFVSHHGARPVAFLDRLGVLDKNVILTHAVHLDNSEVALLGAAGSNVAHCPPSALKSGYGATAVGKFPEMQAQGVNIALGTDGNNNSNYHDLMRATYLLAGLFKDCRQDATLFPAECAFECATLHGARALQMEKQIGSIEIGKKADLVAHDTHRPEWRPLFNVMNQLVWSADGRSVHSVWVDGVRVVDNYHATRIDEERLYAHAQEAGEAIVKRSGLPIKSRWPVI